MKPRKTILKWHNIAAWLVMFVLCADFSAHGFDAEQLRESERGQVDVRGQATMVRQQIDALLAEFERNGLASGEEIKTLTKVRDLLSDLSDSQMSKVVELLQLARSASDATGARNNAVKAYELQKGIIANFRELIAQTQRQHQLNLLSAWVARLAERQNSNFRTTVAVTKETKGQPMETWTVASRDAERVIESEQGSIRDETSQVINQLKALMAADEAMRTKLKPALTKIETEELTTNLANATSQLKAGSLFSAAVRERAARDTLFSLVNLIAVDDTPQQKTQRALDDVDKAIAHQEKIIAKLDSNKPADAASTEQDQADNVDRANRTEKQLEENSKANATSKTNAAAKPDAKASEMLKQAQKAMQATRGNLNAGKTQDAAKSAKEAQTALKEAKNALEKSLDSQQAKSNASPSGDQQKPSDEKSLASNDQAGNEPSNEQQAGSQDGQSPKQNADGQGDKPQPGQGDKSQPGQGDKPQPGQGDKPQPGQGDKPQPGQGDKPQPGQGDKPQPGQGDKPQPGQGDKPQPGQGDKPQPGQGDKPQPGQGDKPQPGQGGKTADSNSELDRAGGNGGARADISKSRGKFIGLPERDRAALVQSRGEKYPSEYGPMIEQYFKNLSDSDSTESGK